MTLDEHTPEQEGRRASAETTAQKDGASAAPPAWLLDLDNQRQGLFDALFTMIEDDKSWCDSFIEQTQSSPEALLKRCVEPLEETVWTLHPNAKYYKEHLEEHKKACLQHIAFLALIINDMRVLHLLSTAPSLENAARLVLLMPGQFDKGLLWIMRSFSQASEHLAAVRMLVNKDHYLANKRKGGHTKARGVEADDDKAFLRPIVKILLQSESHRKNNDGNSEVLERHVKSIMELWKNCPFFYLDRGRVATAVENILIDLGVLDERKKSLFERRRPTPMAWPLKFSVNRTRHQAM